VREGERKKRKKKGSEKKEFKSEKLLGGRVTYRCINCVIVGHSGVSKVDKLQHRRKTNKHKCLWMQITGTYIMQPPPG
jgi:hypothetical protein